MVVGLGSGRAATAFVHALGEKVRAGLNVRCIPTSSDTARLAEQLQIPLTNFEEADAIDVTVDGADEVDPNLNLIKGLGGALVREKIVASASRTLVICVGSEKEVPSLGQHGVLPVEIVPFALGFCRRRINALGCPPTLREHDGKPFLTDNGNYIFDCHVGPITDPEALNRSLLAIPGVVDTGLFLGMAHTVLIQDGNDVRVRSRPCPSLGGHRPPSSF
jgi:ribose 5-phosphate isomerase A